MRKAWLIAGAAIVGLGLVGFGAKVWTERQLVAGIEGAFEAQRRAGWTATHGAITASVLDGRVEIEAINLASPAASADRRSLKAARLSASGMSVGGTTTAPTLSARNLRVADLVVEFENSAAGLPSASFKAPELTLVDATLPIPTTAPASPDERQKAQLDALAGLKIAEVKLPRLESASVMTFDPAAGQARRPPSSGPAPKSATPATPVAMTTSAAYSNIAVRSIADGRIGTVTVDGGTFAMTSLAQATAMTFTEGSFGRSVINDIDLFAQVDGGLARRPAKDGLVRVSGRSEIGPVTVKLLGGTEFTLTGATLDSFSMDPLKASAARMEDLRKRSEALQRASTPEDMVAFIETMATIYEGMSWSGFEVKGVKVGAQVPGAKSMQMVEVGSFRLPALDRGRATIIVEDVSVNPLVAGIMPRNGDPKVETPLLRVLRSLTIKRFDVPTLMRIGASQRPGQPPDPSKVLTQIAGLLDGFEIRDLVMPDRATGQTVELQLMAADWDGILNGIPTRASLTLKGGVPLDRRNPQHAQLLLMGLKRLDSHIDLAAAWDEASRTVRLSKGFVDVEQLGTLTLTGSLGGIDKQSFAPNAPPMTYTLMAADLRDFSVSLRDKGIRRIFSETMATFRPSPLGPGAPTPFADLRTQLAQTPDADQTFLMVLDALDGFVREPGRLLTITVKPRERMPIGGFFMLAPGAAPPSSDAAIPPVLLSLMLLIKGSDVTAKVEP